MPLGYQAFYVSNDDTSVGITSHEVYQRFYAGVPRHREMGRYETARRARLVAWVGHWHAAGWLREDLDVERAADILWAVNSYEPRWLLTDRGWTTDEFTAWLTEILRHALLR